MSGRHLFAAILGLNLVAAASSTLDLTTIDRTIGKEPVYESKEPQYCLLVFGPEAKTRVWLVLDGDVLYVDRNGNGDLTDPEDRMSPLHVYHNSNERPNIDVIRLFFLPRPENRRAAKATEPLLSGMPDVTTLIVEQVVPSDDEPNKALLKSRRERPFWVDVAAATRWEQGAHVAFADSLADAPILHFFGPQQVTWLGNGTAPQLQRGETAEFLVNLTTPGLNSTVKTVTGCPDTAHAVADIEFPACEPGGTPISQRVELKDPGG